MKKYIAVGLSVLLCACSSIPTDNKVGKLDTNYDFGKPENSKNLRVAIVVPYEGIDRATEKVTSSNPLVAALMSQSNQNKTPSNKLDVHQKYAKEVFDAFESNFEKVITVRGFTYSGPYSSVDEITYGDKKNSYIEIMPIFKLNVFESDIHRTNNSSYNEEAGSINIDGSLVVKMIEPLTQQVIAQRRIDLSKLNISEPYVIQVESKGKSDLLSMAVTSAMKSVSAPKTLTINYDDAYAKAMTTFFQASMKQIDKFTSSAEILSYKRDIQELKSNKRF